MPSLSIAEIIDRFPDFRVALVVAEDLQHRRAAQRGARGGNRRGGGGVPRALERDGALRHSRRRRLARGLQGLRHQADELSLVGRAADQARAGRRRAAGGQRAGRPLQRGLARRANSASAATISTRRRAISPSASRDPTTRSSTWAPRRAKTPTIRPRSARSSTPTRATCCAGGGTGARTRAPPSRPKTRRVALTAQSNGVGDVEAAAARLVALIERECAGRCRVVVADRAQPVVAF